MKKLWVKYKTKIVIGAFILVAFIIIYIMVRKKAIKDAVPETVDIPDGNGGSESFNPGPYTDAIYKEVDRDNRISGRNLKPHIDLLELSNPKFVAVFNDWNTRYFQKEKRSLIQRYQDESGYGFPYSLIDSDHGAFNEIKQKIIDRAKTLSLY
jgi:hypothetical protein